jgi:hypothetical protein
VDGGRRARVLLVLAAALSLGGSLRQAAPLRNEQFERELAPFPVLDERGQPYDLPFLGGLNVPRPQFVDIDADGDLDLFVHELSSKLWFFENIGTTRAPKYVWRSDHYHDLDIGEWNKFVDIDGDRDLDLLAELRYSHVRLFRNTGTPQRAAFTMVADSLRDAEGKPIFADRQNILSLVDLDCNERLDLFLGRVDGTVARYEAIAKNSERFRFLTERFEGIEIIGVIDTVGTRHGANTMAFADHDQDQDLDLYWGDFFERGVLLIANQSASCALPALRTQPVQLPGADSTFTSGFNVPVPVDVDGDGDLDFFMGVLGGAFNPTRSAADNFYFYERTSQDQLTLRTRRFLSGIDAGSESAPALGDLDGDGDLDLLIGSKIDPVRETTARLQFFRNEGTPRSPRFRFAQHFDLTTAYHQAPALGDLDGDGDLDLLVGTWNQGLLYFRNDGSAREPRFVADSAMPIDSLRGSNVVPALADLDADGDLDLLVGEASGEVNLLRNEGSAKAARFVLATERLSDIDVGRRSAPALIDIDRDGLLDLVLGREDAGLSAFRNTGSRAEPRFEPFSNWSLPLPPFAAPVFADLDADGAIDLLAGGTGGGLVYYRNKAR